MPQNEPASALPGPTPAALVAFLSGAGVLALEITGARLFMPWFGSSMLVWSNVIGVTLGAVALGNFAGGRLADRRPRRGTLATLLLAAAALTALSPFSAAAVARFALPEGLPLETSFALTTLGSLLAACVALGPPLFFLGAAAPLLLRGAVESGPVGRGIGLVYGAGTAGSLLGTFLPVHVGVPLLGSRVTLLLAASVLALAAAIVARGGRRRVAGAIAVLLAAAAGFVPRGLALNVPEGTKVLDEFESRYQYARVEERDDTVTLRLNEGLDSFHSIWVRGRILTGGAYFDYYPLFVPLAERRAPGADTSSLEALILGHAGGTIARQILALYGDRIEHLRIEGVELDPAVAALGEREFGVPADPRLVVRSGVDGRVVAERSRGTFDLVVVDTYACQIYIPFQMCSLEFFEAARSRLRPGGVLVANLGGFSLQDAPLRAIRNTAARVFGSVGVLRVEEGRNFVLVARKGAAPALVDPDDPALADALRPIARAALRPGSWRVYAFDARERTLTDDRSPIEELADADLLARSRARIEAAAR